MNNQPPNAELEAAVEKSGDYFVAEFKEYALGDLTVAQFAELKGSSVASTEQAIEIGSKIYAQRQEDAKTSTTEVVVDLDYIYEDDDDDEAEYEELEQALLDAEWEDE